MQHINVTLVSLHRQLCDGGGLFSSSPPRDNLQTHINIHTVGRSPGVARARVNDGHQK
jgi:hypothetical protein